MNTLLLLLAPGIPWHVDDPTIRAMHSSVNQWRAHYQAPSLTLDEHCCVLAQRHAERMAWTGHFEHGQHDQIITCGYRTVEGAVQSWVYSPPHFSWILTGRRKCGWGHAVSRDGFHYWAGVFQ